MRFSPNLAPFRSVVVPSAIKVDTYTDAKIDFSLTVRGKSCARARGGREISRMILRICVPIFLVAVGASCRTPTQSPPKTRIAFVTNGVASFWTIAAKGARHAGNEFDAAVSVHMPAEGITDQKRIVQDLLTVGVDGIAISPIDPANQSDLINEAARNSLVVTHDSDAPGTSRLCYIGMDNYRAGRLCGQLLKEALPQGGEIMILVGRLEQDNARRRRQGFIDEVLDRSYDPGRYDLPGGILENEK